MARRQPLAPDLFSLPVGRRGSRLIGVPNGGVVCLSDPAGSVGTYPGLDIERLAVAGEAERAAIISRHTPLVVVSDDPAPISRAARYANFAVCGSLAALRELLIAIAAEQLILGRDAAWPLSLDQASFGDPADRLLAGEALLAHAICERDADCRLRHAFFVHLGDVAWIWHYNYATAAIVPPRPVLVR